MQKLFVYIVGLVGALALLAGLVFKSSPLSEPRDASERPRVVASTSLVGDWVRQVAGDRVELTILAGPNASPHHIDLTPSQVQALNQADLIVSIGNGLEPWLERAIAGSDTQATYFELSEGLPLLARSTSPDDWIARPGMAVAGELPACCAAKYTTIVPQEAVTLAMNESAPAVALAETTACSGCDAPVQMAGGVNEEADDHHDHAAHDTHAGCHDHGDLDPHVWMDVSLARSMVVSLTDALVAIDPANEAAYDAGQEAYLTELYQLDQWIFRYCQEIPDEQRRLLTQHENMRYFAHRYGFALAGSLLGSLSTGEAGPSPFAVNRLLKRIQVQDIRAVFCENIASNKLASQIAREADLGDPHVLITGALTEPGTEGETYVGMMRYNTRTIVNALK